MFHATERRYSTSLNVKPKTYGRKKIYLVNYTIQGIANMKKNRYTHNLVSLLLFICKYSI